MVPSLASQPDGRMPLPSFSVLKALGDFVQSGSDKDYYVVGGRCASVAFLPSRVAQHYACKRHARMYRCPPASHSFCLIRYPISGCRTAVRWLVGARPLPMRQEDVYALMAMQGINDQAVDQVPSRLRPLHFSINKHSVSPSSRLSQLRLSLFFRSTFKLLPLLCFLPCLPSYLQMHCTLLLSWRLLSVSHGITVGLITQASHFCCSNKDDAEHCGAHWHESVVSLCLQAHRQRPRTAAFHAAFRAGRFASFQLSVSVPAFSVCRFNLRRVLSHSARCHNFIRLVDITTAAAAATTLLHSAHSHTRLSARLPSVPSVLPHRSTTKISKI